jgi:methyl-accepting chemotaxis protein
VNKFVHTIRFKIIVSLGACVAVNVAVGLSGANGLAKLNSNMSDTFATAVLPIAQLSDVRASVLDIRAKLRRMQVTRSPEDVAKSASTIDADLAIIDKQWSTYYPACISGDKERAVADQIASGLKDFRAQTDEAISGLKAGHFDAAGDVISRSGDPADALAGLLRDDSQINVDEAKQYSLDGESLYRTLLSIAIVLVGIGLVVAIGVAVYLMRVILRPLRKAIDAANHIADGQLDNRIESDSRGEFGELLDALGKMDRNLSDTVRGIKASTESVSVAAREIASGNTDLSSRTEEQAASLEETAASMTQLTETVKQNADNARQANTLATRATDMADTGNDSVQTMVGTIGQISSSSTKISEITGVIEGIAFQTNILALNAAVEAARAGEQGRGFAVVASEVRSLAQRSAAAAKEIKELISSSVTMIQDGAKQATEVSLTMGQVKQAIKQVSDIVGEITAASDEQSRGIEQVNQAVGQMDEVTQQNAALVEQAAAAAQSLEEQANRLKDAVSAFKLADTGTSAPSRTIPQTRPRPAPSRVAIKHRATPARLTDDRRATADKRPDTAGTATADADWATF